MSESDNIGMISCEGFVKCSARDKISALFNNPELSDVTVATKRNGVIESQFSCHKAILSANSDHFKALFRSGMSETSDNKVVLEDFDADAVRKTLLYCYGGEVFFHDADLESVLVVAGYLGIADLASECEEVVKRAVSADNVDSYLHFAERYHLGALSEYCQAFCLDNLCKVVLEESFLSLPVSTLRLILQSDSLAIESEYAIFEAVQSWVLHDPNRAEYALELLKLVRYPTLLVEDLGKVAQSSLVNSLPELKDQLIAAFCYACGTHVVTSIEDHRMPASNFRPRTVLTGRDFQFCLKKEVWTVPAGGFYRIKACGAKAMDGLHKIGGLGAIVSGVFYLEKDQKVHVLCGGMSTCSPSGSSGGGGGTYVMTEGEDEPLLVAGGGGGSRGTKHDYDGQNASLSPSGADAVGQSHDDGGKGGINGTGGTGSTYLGLGAGGGGFRVHGTDGNKSSQRGKALTQTHGPEDCALHGGFGGGGGGLGGGGGGGYSGGGGGQGGGGGGSFIRYDALQVQKEIGSSGHGSVTITFSASVKGRCPSIRRKETASNMPKGLQRWHSSFC